MERMLMSQLLAWKKQVNRMPLLVRGARQIGKSYLIEQFGKGNFENTVIVNFEQRKELETAFLTFEPSEICNKLKLLLNQSISAGTTLLFLDEIQECPRAIQALRYFKEKMPELHVIAAGSLLEFALNDESFKMPVGRVQNYFLKPLSFKEFLLAVDRENLVDYLANITLKNPIDPAVHELLLSLLRQYLVLGGMPAVIQQYLDTQDYLACQEVQGNILTTYRNDFGKYATKAQYKYLQALFERVPAVVSQHFKYVDIDPHMLSRDLKNALESLRHAGLIYQIFSTKANGLPLNASTNSRKFKLLFLDVGLTQYFGNLSGKLLLEKDLHLINQGQIIEQLVGQELLTLEEYYRPGEIYYWERDSASSTAEIDYVTQVNATVIPIEVKSGITGRLRSLKLFMQEKNSVLGVRASQKPLELTDNILSIPLYMIHELPRLCKQAMNENI